MLDALRFLLFTPDFSLFIFPRVDDAPIEYAKSIESRKPRKRCNEALHVPPLTLKNPFLLDRSKKYYGYPL